MRFNRVDLLLAAAVIGPIGFVPIFGRTPILWCTDVMIVILSIFLLFRVASGKLQFTGAEQWMGLYLLIALLTIVMASDILRFIVFFKLRFMPLLVLLIVYNTLQTQEDLRHTQIGLALCAAGIAVLLLINTYVYSWEYAYRDVGYALKQGARSNIGKNNYLASIYAMLAPFCLSLFSIRHRLLGIATSLIVISATIATQSRGGLLCLIIGMFAWLFMMASPKQKLKSLFYIGLLSAMLAGAYYAISTFLPETVLEVFTGHINKLWRQVQEDPESLTRVQLAKDGLAAFWKSPWIGVGLGGYVDFSVKGSGVQVHNLYIEIPMMTGIFGFLAYMMFLFICGWNLFRLRNVFQSGPERILVASMSAAFLSALLSAAIEPSYWSPVFACLFTIVLAMGFVQRRIVRRMAPATRPAPVAFRPALSHTR